MSSEGVLTCRRGVAALRTSHSLVQLFDTPGVDLLLTTARDLVAAVPAVTRLIKAELEPM